MLAEDAKRLKRELKEKLKKEENEQKEEQLDLFGNILDENTKKE